MTTLGLKIDRWACETLAKFGVRTPLFSNIIEDATGKRVLERQFAVCSKCHRVFPHWWGNITQAEQTKRGFVGCPCGGIRLDMAIIPGWKAAQWMLYGLIWRRAIRRRRLWDPRVPIRDYELE